MADSAATLLRLPRGFGSVGGSGINTDDCIGLLQRPSNAPFGLIELILNYTISLVYERSRTTPWDTSHVRNIRADRFYVDRNRPDFLSDNLMSANPSTPVLPAPTAAAEMRAGKYLIFHLDDEHFGTEVLKVLEIMGLQNITSIPQAPAYVRGVINLRGKVIPVIDLRLKFGMPAKEYLARTCIVVIRTQREEETATVGIIVDGVDEVLAVSASDIEDMPDFGPGIETPYLSGVARMNNSVKLLLNIDYVLNTEVLQSIPNLL
jgi:purine-binding chemotaxis protein CheW